MHYVQDCTQPYHGVPAPIGLILKGVTNFGLLLGSSTNHHYNLEEYQGAMVARNSQNFVDTLRNSAPLEIADDLTPSWLCRHGTYLGRPVVRTLWPMETKFFGDSLNSKDSWYFDLSTLHAAVPGAPGGLRPGAQRAARPHVQLHQDTPDPGPPAAWIVNPLVPGT